jgi:hypothetical protein
MNVLYSALSTCKAQTKRRLIRVKTAERVRWGRTALCAAADGVRAVVHCCVARTLGLGTRLSELKFVAGVF